MKKTIGISLLLVAASLAISGCQVRPAVHARGSVVIHDGPATVAVVFSDRERRHVHDYYRERERERDHDRYDEYEERDYRKGKKYKKGKKGNGRKGLPPGLAKRDHLPPGLAKRDRLPPGLRTQRLPRDLERRLSPLPSGVIRVRIGTELVLMNERTRVVLDVIKDIPLY